MKKIRNVFGYFMLSVLLFLGGVSLDSDPSGSLPEKKIVQQDDQDDKNNQDDQDGQNNLIDNEQNDQDQTADDEKKNDSSLYYYSLLDDVNKKYYDQISEAVAEETDAVVLEGISHDQAKSIFISVRNDHPEYFWLENQYTYREYDGSVEFIFEYNCTGGERKNRQQIIEREASQIVKAMPASSSDYEKVKYVFESLVDQTTYDHDNTYDPKNQNIYSTFGDHLTVCAGYAKGTKYLLDQMGVECIYVTGMAGEYHAWNIVKCDGAYYYVDTTWGDPTYKEGDFGANYDQTSYEYLCCSTEMLSRTHTPDTEFPFPECTDTSLEYYRQQGRYLASTEFDPILQIMKEDIDGGEDITKIQFATSEMVKQAGEQMDPLSQEIRKHAPDLGQIYWVTNEDTGLLTVYWHE